MKYSNIRDEIAERKHQLVGMRPNREAQQPLTEKDDKLQNYMQNEFIGGKQQLYDTKMRYIHGQVNKDFVGHNYYDDREMSREAQLHRQEHMKKRLEQIANLQGLQLGHPDYANTQKMDEINPQVGEKLKTLLINIINNIKNFNVSKEVLSMCQEMQNILLSQGYEVVLSDLDQLQENISTARELLKREVLKESQDHKDNAAYLTMKSTLTNISKIIEKLKPYSEKPMRERKFAQSGIKKEFESKILNKEKILNKAKQSEKNLEEKLLIDDRYIKATEGKKRKKDEEDKNKREYEALLKKYIDVIRPILDAREAEYLREEERYTAEIERINGELEDFYTQKESLNREINTLREEIKVLSRDKPDGYTKKIGKLEKDIKAKKQEVAEHDERLKGRRETLKGLHDAKKHIEDQFRIDLFKIQEEYGIEPALAARLFNDSNERHAIAHAVVESVDAEDDEEGKDAVIEADEKVAEEIPTEDNYKYLSMKKFIMENFREEFKTYCSTIPNKKFTNWSDVLEGWYRALMFKFIRNKAVADRYNYFNKIEKKK